jgi:MoxR-like ATPase
MDRFLMKISVDYPDAASELAIIKLVQAEEQSAEQQWQPIAQSHIFAARDEIHTLEIGKSVEQYIVDLVMATRNPELYSETLASWIDTGSSPRASIALHRASRASAWLAGRDFVTPQDVQSIVHAILRHRMILSYHALADQITADNVIDEILSHVAVG